MNKKRIFSILLLTLFLIGFVSAGNYVYSNPKTTPGTSFNSFQNVDDFRYNNELCQDGQDFIVQVVPGGCTPTVVRSDLLEEENVEVFCQLQAIKINPLITVEAISHITFRGGLPPSVARIDYHPNRAALNRNNELNNRGWNNIGYAVIELRQEVNESAMPDFVSGNIVANIRYGFNKEAGPTRHTFYLPEVNDKTFEENMHLYSFFNNKGYLRASDIDSESASIGIYTGELDSPRVTGSTEKRQVRRLNLESGQSDRIVLPGYDCMTSIDIKLDSVVAERERVRLSINSETIEVRQGEKFLDNKCTVKEITKSGISKSVKIKCSEDEGKTNEFILYITPKIVLSVNNVEKSYSVGDKVYEDDDGIPVFLGYAKSDTDMAEGLKVQLVKAPKLIGEIRLTDSQISISKTFTELSDKKNIFSYIKKNSIYGTEWIIEGTDYEELIYMGEKNIFDKKVSLIGYDGGVDADFNYRSTPEGLEAKRNYDNAISDYDTILESFFSERDPTNSITTETISESGLKEKIELSYKLDQKAKAKTYCDYFSSIFPESEIKPSICDDVIRLSNDGVSTKDVVINGNHKTIYFEDVHVPGFNDYGAVVKYRKIGENIFKTSELTKDGPSVLNGDEEGKEYKDYILLVDLEVNKARIKISTKNKESGSTHSTYETLRVGESVPAGDYEFILEKVNLNNVAKVIVGTSSPLKPSQANFSFNVGIEKRFIQLSPEKTREKIDRINKSLEKWGKISNSLETVVEGMKAACFATGSFLTLKNAVFNSKKAIARTAVMKDWKTTCKDLVDNPDESKNKFNTMDGCYFSFAEDIDKEVAEYSEAMKKTDESVKIATDKATSKTDIFGQKDVNSKELLEHYSVIVKDRVVPGETFLVDGESVSTNEIIEILNDESSMEEGVFSSEDLKDIELYSNLGEDKKEDLNLVYEQIWKNKIAKEKLIESNKEAKEIGYTGPFSLTSTNRNSVTGDYYGQVANDKIFNGNHAGEPIQGITWNHKRYYIILTSEGAGKYSIDKIYDERFLDVGESTTSEIKNHFNGFKKTDGLSSNKFKEKIEVKFFSSGPHKGLPSLVPFDTENGWYARMKYASPNFKGIIAYDDSGALNYFKLCNVGLNGIIENEGEGDDKCTSVRAKSSDGQSIAGLSDKDMRNLVDLAKKGVFDAMNSERSGSVNINGKNIEVGEPDVGVIQADCSDFMSPKECKLLFNLCDPVICPTSRCDFGGEYKVRDVVGSGIVGSLALCLPNVKEGIIAPICLSGVNAGVDALLAGSRAHQECLQISLDTGQTVGICDQQNSIYMCELLWKQAIPLAKIGIPKLLGAFAGENVRGGIEYANVKSAWDTARDSMAFFTTSYGENALKAFRTREISQSEVGGAACKTFVSTAYPEAQNFFKNLISADSPAQYTAEFNEINQNTITSPPVSHYKVSFRIYAGKDGDTTYKVWLRGSDTRYYDDQSTTHVVASSHLRAGEYAAETIDFTDIAGFTELCVRVGTQEDCGFKKVSTSFSSNFFQDQYRKSQADKKDISSEGECISGSPNILALVNSNIQEGVSDVIDPEIYNQGISRVCANDNPGLSTDPNMGTDKQRWMEVGNCGSETLKCWLDIETIDDAFVFSKTSDDLKKEFSEEYDENFMSDNGYLDEEFEAVVSNITKESNPSAKILLINQYMEKIFRNQNKAYLYYARAGSYGKLAESSYEVFKKILENIESAENIKVISPDGAEKTVEEIAFEDNYISPAFSVTKKNSVNTAFLRYNKGTWEFDIVKDSLTELETIEQLRKIEDGEVSLNGFSYWNSRANEFVSIFKKVDGKNYIEGLEVMSLNIPGEIKEIKWKTGITGYKSAARNINDYDGSIYSVYINGEEKNGYLYLIYRQNEWYWNFEKSNTASNSWKKINDITSSAEFSLLDRMRTAISSIPGFQGIGPGITVTNLLTESKNLLKALEGKNNYEGMAVLVASQEKWKSISSLEEALKLVVHKSSQEVVSYIEDNVNTKEQLVLILEDLNENGYISVSSFSELKALSENNFDVSKTQLKSTILNSGNINYNRLSIFAGSAAIIDSSGNVIVEAVDSTTPYDEIIAKASVDYDVDELLIKAVIRQESNFVNVESGSGGCVGLMQFCSAAAVDYGLCDTKDCEVDYRLDEAKNIDAGVKKLRDHLNNFYGKTDAEKFAIASYNGGEGLINKAIRETGISNPTWDLVSTKLTAELLDTFEGYQDGKYWNNEKRIAKVKEITEYVLKVSNFKKAYIGAKVNPDNIFLDSSVDTIDEFILELEKSDYEGHYNDNEKIRAIVESLRSKNFIDASQYNAIKDINSSPQTIRQILAANKNKAGSREEVLKLQKENWPIIKTINFIEGLTGKYGSDDNAYIVNLLHLDNVFTQEEYIEINGEGFWNVEEKMSTVANMLKIISKEKTGKEFSNIDSSDVFGVKSSGNIMYTDTRELLSGDLDKDNQISSAHSDLIGLIECLNSEYFALDSKNIVVTSIADDDLYTKNCDLSNPSESYNSDSNCVHQENSCHYYPSKKSGTITNEQVTSMAIDIRRTGYDAEKLNSALKSCNSKYPVRAFSSDKYYLLESDHYHIVLESCSSESTSVVIPEESEEVCKIIEQLPSTKSITIAGDRVLKAAEELNGENRPSSATNCYDATQYVYLKSGTVTEGRCAYSDKSGTKYFGGAIVTQSNDPTKAFYSNEKSCLNQGYEEKKKLDGIYPGDLLSIVYDKTQAHNVIFIEWENREENLAKVFDWNGPGRTFGYITYDLSDDSHPVYMYWAPRLK